MSMDAESKTTKDHEEIRNWVTERGGRPAVVQGTKSDGDGVLRIDFPGGAEDGRLEEITWDEFFQIFDKNNLTFLYQEQLESGEQSRFFKFIRE